MPAYVIMPLMVCHICLHALLPLLLFEQCVEIIFSPTMERVPPCTHQCPWDLDKTPKTEATLPSTQKGIQSSASFGTIVFHNLSLQSRVVCTIPDGKWGSACMS